MSSFVKKSSFFGLTTYKLWHHVRLCYIPQPKSILGSNSFFFMYVITWVANAIVLCVRKIIPLNSAQRSFYCRNPSHNPLVLYSQFEWLLNSLLFIIHSEPKPIFPFFIRIQHFLLSIQAMHAEMNIKFALIQQVHNCIQALAFICLVLYLRDCTRNFKWSSIQGW